MDTGQPQSAQNELGKTQPDNPGTTHPDRVPPVNVASGDDEGVALQLEAELLAVQEELTAATRSLHPLLTEFIQREMETRRLWPRALVVLAAGFPLFDTHPVRQGRIYLAAALEMLHIALSIHKLLLRRGSPTPAEYMDKTLLGGTILAGDFCFSRAASLAASTENPRVVALFAELLKDLSEANLRMHFHEDLAASHEHEALFQAGAAAGAVIAGLGGAAHQAVVAFSAALGKCVTGEGSLAEPASAFDLTQLPPYQIARWRRTLAWLTLHPTRKNQPP